MKNQFKKVLSVLLVLVILVGMTACQSEKLVIKDSDTYIVIKTTAQSMDGATDMTLMDYMTKLKDKGDLEFAISDGMITSINGIDNPADYSSCWMLYTSDPELSNSAWGTVEYEGVEYGSAVSGAEALTVKAGQLYIWVYQSFS